MSIQPAPLFCCEACASADVVRSFGECPECKKIWSGGGPGNWGHYRNNAWAICNACSIAQHRCARCGGSLVNLIVDYEAIMDDLSPSAGTVDLSTPNGKLFVLAGFGNGIFTEIRVVGHSTEATFYFVRLIQGGGYGQHAFEIADGRKLYRAGDACFPAEAPFIFVAPVTVKGETMDFRRLEPEIQRRADEIANKLPVSQASVAVVPIDSISWMNTARPAKPWWKLW